MSTLFDWLKSTNHTHWNEYLQHPFVVQLGQGTLPQECFQHYLRQDYIFLIHFARTFGLAAFKSRNLAEIKQANALLSGIVDIEMDLHIQYCEEWGISEQELENTVESTANMAYTRYVMERGLAGDLLDLNVALAPCIIGYAGVANWLLEQPCTVREGNPYDKWISMYESQEYQDLATAHQAAIDKVKVNELSDERLNQLSATFAAATRLEIGFWQMGIDLS